MKREFMKLHGAGNNFLVVEPSFFGMENKRPKENTLSKQDEETLKPIVAALCDNHFSVGGDGLLMVSEVGENFYKMNMFNNEGTAFAMCGNGLRCVAAYLHIKGKQGNNFVIATDMGDMSVKVVKTGKKTYFVEINMGILNKFEQLPVQSFEETHPFARYIQGVTPYWCSIGHIVLFLTPQQWTAIQEDKAYNDLFTHFNKMKYSNINFCRIDSPESIAIVTCELGAGVTYACGTGSTSAAFVAHRLGLAKATVNMENKGGRIIITTVEKEEGKYELLMNGPAEYAYSGVIEDECP